MAQIPANQKFHTLNANTPTQERGSAQADGLRDIYTMQDIIDSVTTGGSITGQVVSYELRQLPFDGFSDGEYEGKTLDFGNNFATFGQPGTVYYWNGSVWDLVDNTSVSSSTSIIGVCTNKATDGFFQTILVDGIVRLKDALTLTIGNEAVYVGGPGALTVAPPTGLGEVVRIAGHAYNLSDPYMVHFNPLQGWLEIQ